MTAIGSATARLGRGKVGVALLLALAYLWELYGAVSNLQFWVQITIAKNLQLTAFAWIVLVLGLAIPVVTYLLALIVSRRRGAASSARILFVAFCASEALTFSLLAFFEATVQLV